MNRQIALTLARAEKRTSSEPMLSTALAQILAMQQIMVMDFLKCENAPALRARLAIAFSALEDRRCRLKGIPNPGMLRPDLDPDQLAKAVRRSKARNPIELAQELAAILPTDAKELDTTHIQPPKVDETPQREKISTQKEIP